MKQDLNFESVANKAVLILHDLKEHHEGILKEIERQIATHEAQRNDDDWCDTWLKIASDSQCACERISRTGLGQSIEGEIERNRTAFERKLSESKANLNIIRLLSTHDGPLDKEIVQGLVSKALKLDGL